jgi:hypothetical protein
VSTGLVGCVRSLRINSLIIDLRTSVSRDIRRHERIGVCTRMVRCTADGTCGIDPCASLPCHRDAVCRRVDDTRYECVCAAGHTGARCMRRQSPCDDRPCANGGTCVDARDVDSVDEDTLAHAFECRCAVDFVGNRCEYGRWAIEQCPLILLFIACALAICLLQRNIN